MATSSVVGSGKKICISFAGAGFLGVYHLGVITCLYEHGRTWLAGVDRYAGTSAGAMIATMMALGQERLDFSAAQEFVLSISQEMHKKRLSAFTPGTNIINQFRDYFEKVLPEDAHEVVNGRLYISVTNARTRKNELVSQFESREDLIDYILASSCVPGFNGIKPIHINNTSYFDGGLTTNLPILNQYTTIRVSPFCGRVEIGPRDRKAFGPFLAFAGQDIQLSRVNLGRIYQSIFPPKREDLMKYHRRGYNEALRFLFIQDILRNVTGDNLDDSDVIDVDDIDIENETQLLLEAEKRKSRTSLNKKEI